MYRILILVFVSLCAVVLYSMEENGKKVDGYTLLYEQIVTVPAAAQGLVIAVDDSACTSNSSSPLTSPPLTVPLTPSEPTGDSPLFPSTPNPEELNALLSPSVPDPEQQSLAKERMQRFSGIKANGFSMQREQEQRCAYKKRCFIVGSCLGCSVLAAVIYVIQRYAF